MVLNKQDRIERDKIVEKTGLLWKGKNMFYLISSSDNRKIDLSILEENMKDLGYKMNVDDDDNPYPIGFYKGDTILLNFGAWFVRIKNPPKKEGRVNDHSRLPVRPGDCQGQPIPNRED